MKPITSRQLAAMNMCYQRYSFDYFLDSMERLDIQNFELWTGAPHFCNFTKSLSDVKTVRSKVEQRGMKIVCVTPEQVVYPYNIAASDLQLRRLSIDYFKRYIEQTAQLGADKMLCCSGWGNYDEDVNEAWKRSIEGLNEMAGMAEKVGIILVFEILGPQETNLVYNLNSTIQMMNEIKSPAFKLCVDTVPIKVAGHKLDDFFEEFGSRICHVHLTDGTPAGHVPCGDGDHPIAEYLATLSRYEYQGYITLEIGDMNCMVEPEKATRRGFDTVTKLLP